MSSLFIWSLVCCASIIKILLIPAYHSTDFEVHRNWLAITNSLPIKRWYYENTSEWTLDYPPFFAYFEYALSKPAEFIDSQMLKVDNLNYKSQETIIYQRITVILSEFLLIYALFKFLSNLKDETKQDTSVFNKFNYLAIQFLFNFGLIVIDNIHFQYNGFLFGILFLSIYCLQKEKWLLGSLLFSSLLNFKHIYLYVAPAFGFYILVFRVGIFDKRIGFLAKISRLVCIGLITVLPFIVSFGPFVYMDQLSQVLSRLFPFKRGLCHAYWAPNFWSLYNITDKILIIIFSRFNLISHDKLPNSKLTSGLVQDITHSILPNITPLMTFILSFIFMIIPIFIVLCKKEKFKSNQILNIMIVTCAYSSFLFGWHVHEKAILLISLPFSLLSIDDAKLAKNYFILNTIGNYSLFPLLFKQQEYPIKMCLWMLTTTYNYVSHKNQFKNKFNLNKIELTGMIGGVLSIELYNSIIHTLFGIDKKLSYLPLMLTSVFSAVWIIYSWFLFLNFIFQKIKQKKD